VESLREEVEDYRNDKDENSIHKLEEHAMLIEEKLQRAEETLEEERASKTTEIKEIKERAIHQRMGIEVFFYCFPYFTFLLFPFSSG